MTDLPLDHTHDPAARSWVPGEGDFPVQNLPLGVLRRAGSGDAFGGAVAIGDFALTLRDAAPRLEGPARQAAEAAAGPSLAPLMALRPEDWRALRHGLFALLRQGSQAEATLRSHLLPLDAAEMTMPARPGAFVDFFASIEHATNAGRLFRPDNPLLPNYRYVPIAYHGRASTIRVGGGIPRPRGQTKRPDAAAPEFGPCRRLDYEIELGLFLGGATQPGCPVPIGAAARHLFGVCLLNDWSARDIQAWEYQPLGPFLAKSFATSVSPWIVTAEALRPFSAPAVTRAPGDPAPLPHLHDAADQAQGALAITMEGQLRSARMRADGHAPHRLSRSDAALLYWTPAQMIAHLTSNGCNIEPADLLGTGTISGPSPDALGSLLEITRGGSEALALPNGEQRIFLEDGDEVLLRAWCEADGFARIGFGACDARILPTEA